VYLVAFIVVFCLFIKVAHYNGYVQVDWEKIHKDLSKRGREFVRRSKATQDFDTRSVSVLIHSCTAPGRKEAVVGQCLE